MAMMRGVYCPPATWMATRSDPKVKTMKDSENVTTALNIAFAPSMPSPSPVHVNRASRAYTRTAKTCSSTTAKSGMIQSDERT